MDLLLTFKFVLSDLHKLATFIFIVHIIRIAEGQCTSDTRPLVLSSSNSIQYFSSPAYPADYPPNADCTWHIQAPNEYDKIILNVELFRTQQDEFLKIYDGGTVTGTLLAEIDDTNQKQSNAFVSPGDELYFTFQSDGENEATGFNILFFSNQSANQHACGETITVSSAPQIFMSPNLPNQFTADDGCNWLFTSASGAISFQIFLACSHGCKPICFGKLVPVRWFPAYIC
ncbi:deleted in malignant brain tumors 1 protein-like [Ruditapes philippinarum]|uniref:deleted in malignant brain tumors 1 protein-like n=1 Tax=Ruditapes philippinarum TaxID=129788 RepID=UPI00295B946F|nr:deleted in malignant brain tumors 1 protein-like [Ruditapes philippinarum]